MKWNTISGFLVFLFLFLTPFLLHSGTVITNESIPSSFREPHNVMKQQSKLLQELLNAYLRGGEEKIKSKTAEVLQNMSEITQEYQPQKGREAAQWKFVARIMENVSNMQESMDAGNYQKSYESYSLLLSNCIACHQLRRSWGAFPEPPPSSSGPNTSEQDQTPQ